MINLDILKATSDKNDSYIQRLANLFTSEKPLAKLIDTGSGYYLYDTGTNKIMECREEIYDLLTNLLRSDFDTVVNDFINRHGYDKLLLVVREIIEAVETEKILQVKQASLCGLCDHLSSLENILDTSVQAINLEVTQVCNLRCIYCIYQDHFKEKRNYSCKEMSFSIARKAIDFLKRNSSQQGKVSIGFYGGEPLIRFPFIKQCVEYARSIFTNQQIEFNITTNATLINEEVAEFLVREEFFVMVSLDGPKTIHDSFRVDQSGNGSFDQTIQGLKLLAGKHKETQKGTVAINMVYTPPYQPGKLDAINSFFKQIKWLPGNVYIFSHYPISKSLPAQYMSGNNASETRNLFDWACEKYQVDGQDADSLVKMQMEERLAKFIQRPVLPEPADLYPFNGCCIPGQRKNYITTDGEIQVCEKMPSKSPSLGNVETGFDFDTIRREYIEGYMAKGIESCSRCWGLRLCEICYIYAFDQEGNFNLDKKKQRCQSVLRNVEKALGYFVTLLDKSPGKLDYLYQFEIK